MKNHFIKRGLFCGIGIIACVFAAGFVVQHLWNWLIPAIFTGATVISYCQALGILVLSKILFGGFKGRRGCGCGCGCGGNRGGFWRSRFKANWEGMSAEEREKLRKCCGSDCEPEEKK